jgi:rod shape-determining protein MreB and related proteins
MPSVFGKLKTRPSLAVDLGTANTRIYSCEKGMIAEEPSIVNMLSMEAHHRSSDEAINYLNSKFISFPLRGGVIAEADKAVSLLKPLFKRVHTLRSPVSLACAPTDTTERERKLLSNAICSAGASHVAIVPEPWAAAVGAGISMDSPCSQLLIDIGDGVTDLVVIKNGRLVFTSAIRIACSDLHRAVRSSITGRYRFSPHYREIERLTSEVEGLLDSDPVFHDKKISVEGIDVIRRREASINVTRREIIRALEPVLNKVLRMIQSSVDNLSEEILSELQDSGIVLTGGGSCIKGIDRLIELKTGLKTTTAKDPTHAVINGAKEVLEFWKCEKSWWNEITWPL